MASLENSSVFSGLTTIGSALYSMGISLGDVLRYEASLKEMQPLLIVHGAATTVESARQLLEANIGERSDPADIDCLGEK